MWTGRLLSVNNYERIRKRGKISQCSTAVLGKYCRAKHNKTNEMEKDSSVSLLKRSIALWMIMNAGRWETYNKAKVKQLNVIYSEWVFSKPVKMLSAHNKDSKEHKSCKGICLFHFSKRVLRGGGHREKTESGVSRVTSQIHFGISCSR